MCQMVIAEIEEESEIASVIRETGCGIVIKLDDVKAIRSAILHLNEGASARETMGSNGRRYLERYRSLEKNVALYEEIFCTLAGDEVLGGGA